MIASRTHLRALDRISDFRRQIIDPVDAALKGPEPLQLFEFACGYEIPAHPTVTGNCDRLALRLFPVASKGFGEFSSGDGAYNKIRKPRITSNLRKMAPPRQKEMVSSGRGENRRAARYPILGRMEVHGVPVVAAYRHIAQGHFLGVSG